MRKIKWIIPLTVMAIALAACGTKGGKDSAGKTSGSDAEKFIYYTCPMESHKQIHSLEPGKCSECGMTLVAAVVTSEEKHEFYGCPMASHSHVRQDEPGVCADCGMTLEPMRLKKNG